MLFGSMGMNNLYFSVKELQSKNTALIPNLHYDFIHDKLILEFLLVTCDQ